MNKELQYIFGVFRTLPALSPRPHFVKNARIRILNQVPDTNKQVTSSTLSLGLALFRVVLVIIIAFLLLGEGLVYTAGFSVPGGALYRLRNINTSIFSELPVADDIGSYGGYSGTGSALGVPTP